MISANRKQILDALHQELSDFRFRPLHLPYPLEVEGVLHGVSPPHAPILPLSFLGTERLADRTHLKKLGNYHRGGDDDILLHLLHSLLPKNLQRGDAVEGNRQQCAYGNALLLCLRAARHLCG